jgi:hypothetical protein
MIDHRQAPAWRFFFVVPLKAREALKKKAAQGCAAEMRQQEALSQSLGT